MFPVRFSAGINRAVYVLPDDVIAVSEGHGTTLLELTSGKSLPVQEALMEVVVKLGWEVGQV